MSWGEGWWSGVVLKVESIQGGWSDRVGRRQNGEEWSGRAMGRDREVEKV